MRFSAAQTESDCPTFLQKMCYIKNEIIKKVKKGIDINPFLKKARSLGGSFGIFSPRGEKYTVFSFQREERENKKPQTKQRKNPSVRLVARGSWLIN